MEPPLAAPPRRGPRVLVAVAVAVVVAAVAIGAYVLLRGRGDPPPETDGGRAPVVPGDGDFQDILRDILGDAGDLLGGQDLGLFECLAGSGGFGGTGASAPGGIEAQVRQVARQVEEIRELVFDEPVEPEFVPPDGMAERVRGEFLEDYPPELAAADDRALTALRAIPPDLDLRDAISRALGSQVAGFYDPVTGELVVSAGAGALDVLSRVTLAHELEHALADQNLDLPVRETPDPEREDEDLAALALVEGDATLTMQRYAISLPFDEQFGLLDPRAIAEAEAGLQGMPDFLRRQLLFPYEDGLSFVCDLYAQGGWAAVDEAYANPPDATLEVLFPERYPEFEPVNPPDPRSLDAPWQLEQVRSIGAATLMWLFEAPGGDPELALADPRAAVAGWRGGEVHLWTNGDETAYGMVLAQDGTSLCEPVRDWFNAAYADGGGSFRALSCEPGEVRVAIGSSQAQAESLASPEGP